MPSRFVLVTYCTRLLLVPNRLPQTRWLKTKQVSELKSVQGPEVQAPRSRILYSGVSRSRNQDVPQPARVSGVPGLLPSLCSRGQNSVAGAVGLESLGFPAGCREGAGSAPRSRRRHVTYNMAADARSAPAGQSLSDLRRPEVL